MHDYYRIFFFIQNLPLFKSLNFGLELFLSLMFLLHTVCYFNLLRSFELIVFIRNKTIPTVSIVEPFHFDLAPAPALALLSTICCCKKSFEKIHFTSQFTGGLFNPQKGTSDLLCSSSTSLEGTD